MSDVKKKKSTQNSTKPQLFVEIHTQMLEDENKSFWDLVPVHNNLMGRTASHVLFRSVGVGMSQYFQEKLIAGVDLPKIDTELNAIELAEAEFLSVWNTTNSPYTTTLTEALAFSPLIEHRDYELWLVQALVKIPLTQWEKQKDRVLQCGNPMFIMAYNAWRDVFRGRVTDTPYAWLPKDMTVLEAYVASRVLKGYALSSELTERVTELKKGTNKHGYDLLEYTQKRTQEKYGNQMLMKAMARKERGYVEMSLTESGYEYYEEARVLWGLWTDSIQAVAGDEVTLADTLPYFSNSLASSFTPEVYTRIRDSFVRDWMLKHMTSKNGAKAREDHRNKHLDEANAEIARLEKEMRQAVTRAELAEKEVVRYKEKQQALEATKKTLLDRVSELEAKLKASEKKLSAAQRVVVPTLVDPVTPVKVLEDKVVQLESALQKTNCRIDDLYALLSGEGVDVEELVESYECLEALGDKYSGDVREFKGRIILNGGAKTWQERVRKWFEDHGVKVRVFELGADVIGIKATDVVLMNVIQNKHKYSVKFMNEVRSFGSRLTVCNVNNVEQTLRLVFEQPEHQKC